MSLGTRGAWIASALIVTMGVAPAAVAGGTPLCSEVPDASDAHLTGDYHLATGVDVDVGPEDGGTSVDSSATGVWEDTNRLEGIQTESGTCRDGNGRTLAYDADTRAVSGPANDSYDGLQQDVNEVYDDTIDTVNDTWMALVDMINSLV